MHKELPVRKKIRLEGYDYTSNGAYFVTLCVKDRQSILWEQNVGAISNRPNIKLSKIGINAENAISELNEKIAIDKYVIMPNHIHMIVRIESGGRTEFAPTISSIIRFYKSCLTKQLGYSIWQKSYHDHIIRSEEDYRRYWQYIDENPVKWAEDEYFK